MEQVKSFKSLRKAAVAPVWPGWAAQVRMGSIDSFAITLERWAASWERS
jgi:hypothetical protein